MKLIKILLAFLVLFISIIALFLTWRYVSYLFDTDPYKTFLLPRVELSFFDITSLTPEKTEMQANMLVKNQFPFSFKADSLRYSLFINDEEVMKSRYAKSIILKGNDSSWVSLPVTIFTKDLIAILNKYEHKKVDSVNYRLKATFYTNLILRKKINIDIIRLLPLIHSPDTKVEQLKLESLNFSRAAFQLLVSVNNRNIFPIKARNVIYEFSLQDNEWIKGTIPGLTIIEAKHVSELKIPLIVSLGEVRKTLFDLLIKGSNVEYKLHLVFKIDSENNMLGNSNVTLQSSGTVNSLMKVVKL